MKKILLCLAILGMAACSENDAKPDTPYAFEGTVFGASTRWETPAFGYKALSSQTAWTTIKEVIVLFYTDTPNTPIRYRLDCGQKLILPNLNPSLNLAGTSLEKIFMLSCG
jgi:hypothetical protein